MLAQQKEYVYSSMGTSSLSLSFSAFLVVLLLVPAWGRFIVAKQNRERVRFNEHFSRLLGTRLRGLDVPSSRIDVEGFEVERRDVIVQVFASPALSRVALEIRVRTDKRFPAIVLRPKPPLSNTSTSNSGLAEQEISSRTELNQRFQIATNENRAVIDRFLGEEQTCKLLMESMRGPVDLVLSRGGAALRFYGDEWPDLVEIDAIVDALSLLIADLPDVAEAQGEWKRQRVTPFSASLIYLEIGLIVFLFAAYLFHPGSWQLFREEARPPLTAIGLGISFASLLLWYSYTRVLALGWGYIVGRVFVATTTFALLSPRALDFSNVLFDSSAPTHLEARVAQIVDWRETPGMHALLLEMSDGKSRRIYVPRYVYEHANVGDQTRLTVRNGALRWPWIEAVDLIPE